MTERKADDDLYREREKLHEDDKTTLDGRLLVAMIRDGAIQPNGHFAPQCATVLLVLDENNIEIRAIEEKQGVVAYATYDPSLFNNLNLPRNRRVPCIFNLDRTLEYYSRLATGLVDVVLLKEKDATLPYAAQVEGTLEEGVQFQNKIPLETDTTYRDRATFDPDNYFAGKEMSTVIKTTTDELDWILNTVDKSGAMDVYPLRVDDGELRIDVTSQRDEAEIWGTLAGEVEGPDILNYYLQKPLKRVIRRLNGRVELRTKPSGPLIVTKEREDRTIRYRLSHAG